MAHAHHNTGYSGVHGSVYGVNRLGRGLVHLVSALVALSGGVALILLGIRSVLSLIGANIGSQAASYVYYYSQPFVSPFTGLLNNLQHMVPIKFELDVVAAIIFWALLTWVAVRLLRMGEH